jgi:hypothetical protein
MADNILNVPAPADAQPDPVATGDNTPDAGNPPAETQFDYAALVGDNGNFAQNWRECLPEDIRGEKCLDNIHNFESMVKSYVSGQRMIGAKKVAIPGENSTADDWNAFYSAIGRPAKADDYKLDNVKLPEGIELDDEQLAAYRKFAHDNGMTQKTFEAALAYDVARVEKQMAAAAAAAAAELSETEGKLKKDWGLTYQQQLGYAQRALQEYGLVNLMNTKALSNNYDFIVAMAKIGATLSESRMPDGAKNTPADIDSQLQAITGDMNHAYYKREHPQHEAAVKEVMRLLDLKQRSMQN